MTPKKTTLELILFRKYAKYIKGNEPITELVIAEYLADLKLLL